MIKRNEDARKEWNCFMFFVSHRNKGAILSQNFLVARDKGNIR